MARNFFGFEVRERRRKRESLIDILLSPDRPWWAWIMFVLIMFIVVAITLCFVAVLAVGDVAVKVVECMRRGGGGR